MTGDATWLRMSRAAGLLGDDGRPHASIFSRMSTLATQLGALNLGQGFPDDDGPQWLKDAASAAIAAGFNQYPPGPGQPELRQAIAAHQRRHYGLEVDPRDEVLVTTGATEAIAATVVALAGPGDDVVTLEPYYDAYAADIALAGARHVPVPLRRTEAGFRLDREAFDAAVTDATRLIILNSPHNPTGMVLDDAELGVIAAAAIRHDVIVVTDEVYEHLTFGASRHLPIATLAGMAERTMTISSSGKTFSMTGWKIGWVHGPAHLVAAVTAVKQFLTYVSGAPFQPAVATALADDTYPRELAASLARRRDILVAGLENAGFSVTPAEGTYFVVADATGLGWSDGHLLADALARRLGVVGIPMSAFCLPGSPAARTLAASIRFTFVKNEATLREATRRLSSEPIMRQDSLTA